MQYGGFQRKLRSYEAAVAFQSDQSPRDSAVPAGRGRDLC